LGQKELLPTLKDTDALRWVAIGMYNERKNLNTEKSLASILHPF
jgi:hypothetical protein